MTLLYLPPGVEGWTKTGWLVTLITVEFLLWEEAWAVEFGWIFKLNTQEKDFRVCLNRISTEFRFQSRSGCTQIGSRVVVKCNI